MRSRSGTILNIISKHKLAKLRAYAAGDFDTGGSESRGRTR
jgi:hypothetical protein